MENSLIKNLDNLILKCNDKNSLTYDSLIFEVGKIVDFIVGKDSLEYKNFISIQESKMGNYEKQLYVIDILNELKSKLLNNQIEIKNKYNWDELLHPIIYKLSYEKVVEGSYVKAVKFAIEEINNKVKNLHEKHKSEKLNDVNLFDNLTDNKEELLLVGDNDFDAQTIKEEREGYKFLLIGLKKISANLTENSILTQKQAMQYLVFCSIIMNKLDEYANN